MPADYFLWFEQPAKSSSLMSGTNATQPQGESTDKFLGKETKYKALEILTFNFGVSHAETTGSGTTGSSAGRAKFEDFTITKWVDKASVPLYNACAAGAHFPTVMLAIRKAGGSNLLYVQYIFRQVFVTNISWDGGSGEENFKETVKFKYGALGIQYARQKPDGSADVPVNSSWSCLANKSTLDVPPLPSANGFLDVEQQ
jgi:type VI secretion system secreted protein Hcp